MGAFHAEKFTQSQLLTLTRRSTRSFPRSPFTCPLCNCVPEDIALITQELGDKAPYFLSKHIAGHLKSLSFLSLPYRDDTDQVPSEASRDASFGRQEDRTDTEQNSAFDSDVARISLTFDDDDPSARITDVQRSLGTDEWVAGEPGIRHSAEFESAESWDFIAPRPYNRKNDVILQSFIARANEQSPPVIDDPWGLQVLRKPSPDLENKTLRILRMLE
ncbi:hypothetical protein VTN77DRAFT_3621 [Rasamsonia byssochlamydoides]|uniref:uncharacterized protein n=1 Tax=Rasamsonia byssochlamydoides TaxID=89139 RepID=UPI0037432E55